MSSRRRSSWSKRQKQRMDSDEELSLNEEDNNQSTPASVTETMYDSDWVDDFLFKSHFTDNAMKKGRDYDSQYAEEEEEQTYDEAEEEEEVEQVKPKRKQTKSTTPTKATPKKSKQKEVHSASYLRTWEETFDILNKFQGKHGHCNVKERQDRRLHVWVMNQRGAYKRGTLPKDKIKKLENIGFDWAPAQKTKENAWNKHYEELCAYKEENGDIEVPHSNKLYKWIASQSKRELTKEQKDLLTKLGVPLTSKTATPKKRRSFVENDIEDDEDDEEEEDEEEEEDLDEMQESSSPELQRKKRKTSIVAGPKEVVYAPAADDAYFIDKLMEYEGVYGHVNVPHLGEHTELASWIDEKREMKKAGTLPDETRVLLNKIGINWEARPKSKREKVDLENLDEELQIKFFSRLHEITENDDENTPYTGEWTAEEKTLFKYWYEKYKPTESTESVTSTTTTTSKKAKSAKAKQYTELVEIAQELPTETSTSKVEKWAVRNFEDFFNKLKEHYEKSSAPLGTLSSWCSKMRKAKRDGILTDEQIEKMDSIGFDWNPQRKRIR